MYVPEHFAMSEDAVRELLATPAAGELVTSGENGLDATRLPFVYDPDTDCLVTHMSRVNPQWQEAAEDALVILDGPQGYVSSQWLLTGADASVPTWNYVTLHVFGKLVVHTDPAKIVAGLQLLTEAFGSAYHDDLRALTMPRAELERLLPAIVGIEVRIERTQAKAKMSQNKTPAQVERVADAFAMAGNKQAAAWMRETSLPRALAKKELVDGIAAGVARAERDVR